MSAQPKHGHTKSGHPLHEKTEHYLPSHTILSRFNSKVALLVTKGVGTMVCAWLFCIIALVSLPAILTQANWVSAGTFPSFLIAPGLILIVAWVAQTFIQLVLLSIIMVGQTVQSAASDARAAKSFEDTELLVDRLDLTTDGGITELLKEIESLHALLKPTKATPAKATVAKATTTRRK